MTSGGAQTQGTNIAGRVCLALIVLGVSAACALNMASSKLSNGERMPLSPFPKRVGVATIIGNLAARQDATDRLSRGLVDLGFQVVANNWDMDKVLGEWARGVDESVPEIAGLRLQRQYGLEGIFVGILSQDKGNFIDETHLDLKLMSVPGGKLLWSARVRGGGITNLSGGVQKTAVSAVDKALQSLKKDLCNDAPPKRKEAG